MEESRTYHLLSYGLGGHHADASYIDREGNRRFCTISGYDSPEVTLRRLEAGEYTAEQLEGCLLLDKREILEQDQCLAVAAPMSDASLAPGTIKPFDRRRFDDGIGPFLTREWRRVGWGHLVYGHGGHLRRVTRSRRARGARVGRIEGGVMIWDDPPAWTQYELIEKGGETGCQES